VQLEVLKSVFKIYTSEDKDIFGLALKILETQFLEQRDPNLRYLGLKQLNGLLNNSDIVSNYSPKLVKMLKNELESSIIDSLVGMMHKIIQKDNSELILISLFEKFKQH